ncbi:kinase-like protein, partial [Auricularia subglabra TFB-10046 SS5]
EPAAMAFIAQNTDIPVPRVLDTFVVGRQHFIVMEYIRDARSLWDTWKHLSPEELETIACEVVRHIQTMRSLQPPSPQAVCNAAGGPLTDFRLTLSPIGPYDTHADYHRWIGFSHYIDTYGERSPDLLELRQKTWRSVFSHCDFSPRNVLVRDGHVAAIIDWEFSGWYPEYVEY